MIARPVEVTHHVDAWCTLLSALGATVLLDDGRMEALLGSGRVALRPPTTSEACGTHLGFAVAEPDVTALAATLPAAGAQLTAVDATTWRVTAADGTALTLTDAAATPIGDAAAARADAPVVEPLWYTPDVPAAVGVLTALGLRRRIASTSGGWVDLEAPRGGLTAAHRDAVVRAELAFEHADLDALLARVTDAGVQAVLVDEAYGRSLRLPHPDSPADPSRAVFVNETQRDLYGFTRA